MTQAIDHAAPIGLARNVFGADRIAVLKEQLGRGWREPMTDAELEHIALIYQRTHLDPLAKPAQIYYIKRWDSKLRKEVMTPQISIDGLRLVAQRSRKRFQQVGPQWTADGKEWLDVWLLEKPPAAARVGIRQQGFPEPTWSVATWREFVQTQDEYDARGNKTGRKVLAPFWEKMGPHMLAKTAEALALKRQFSLETNELELARIDEDWRQEQPRLAERYTEIFGADEDSSPYELPSGRLVDTVTGEVLSDRTEAQVAPQPGPSSPGAAAGDHAPPSSAPSGDNPLIGKYQRNRQLVARAKELGIAGFEPLALGRAEDVVEAANLELETRIARALELAEIDRQRKEEGLL